MSGGGVIGDSDVSIASAASGMLPGNEDASTTQA